MKDYRGAAILSRKFQSRLSRGTAHIKRDRSRALRLSPRMTRIIYRAAYPSLVFNFVFEGETGLDEASKSGLVCLSSSRHRVPFSSPTPGEARLFLGAAPPTRLRSVPRLPLLPPPLAELHHPLSTNRRYPPRGRGEAFLFLA